MAGRRDTGRNRMAARSVVLAGVLVMVVAGWQAMAYSTFLDPDDVCTVHHLCDEAANTAALHALSWWTAGGFVVVCLGLGWIG